MPPDSLDTSLDNPLIQLCLRSPESRGVIAHAVGTDRGGKGILLKFRMFTDETETVFMPAPGVAHLIDALRTNLAEIGACDPGHIAVQVVESGPHVPYNDARPKILSADWKVDAKDGKTVSVHGDLVVMMNMAFLVFTIMDGPPRVFRLEHNQCFVLMDDLGLALPMMKVNRTSPPRSNLRN